MSALAGTKILPPDGEISTRKSAKSELEKPQLAEKC